MLVALAGPAIRPDATPNANDQVLERALLAPGSEWTSADGTTQTHWLGTDRYGRDVLSRLMAGSAISLGVGFTAVLISLFIGILLGAGPATAADGSMRSSVGSSKLCGRCQRCSWSSPSPWHLARTLAGVSRHRFDHVGGRGAGCAGAVFRLAGNGVHSSRASFGFSDLRVMLRHMLPNATGPSPLSPQLILPRPSS